MLVMSWNVAAWPKTVEMMGNPLSEYLDKHKCDILCLQEVKMSCQKIVEEGRAFGAHLDGWETFWSPCLDKSQKGFQGVATFSKVGLTFKCNPAPLEVPELDVLGRCILTFHEHFILFNVYAPAASNSGGDGLLVVFYRALGKAIHKQRELSGKPVILCGDLNLAAGPLDVHYSRCEVNIKELLGTSRCICSEFLYENVSGDYCCAFKEAICTVWPDVEIALATREIKAETTKSSATGEPRQRYRLQLRYNGKNIKLGKLQDSESYCNYMYQLNEHTIPDPEDDSMELMVSKGGNISVGDLRELIHLIGDPMFQRPNSEWIKLSNRCGASPTAVCIRQWFDDRLNDGMVDSFRYFYPDVSCRYTCWNQYTNARYINNGSRIDYMLVDKELVPHLLKGTDLRCGCDACPKKAFHHVAAKCAATAAGGYAGASFAGGGIVEATGNTLNKQWGAPHTGFLYTSPRLSDHIAISLLLDLHGGFCSLDSTDKKTRQSQPHKAQSSIASFFRKRESSNPKSEIKPVVKRVRTAFQTKPVRKTSANSEIVDLSSP